VGGVGQWIAHKSSPGEIQARVIQNLGTILSVHDNQGTRNLLSSVGQNGFTVLTAGNPAEGIHFDQNRAVSLALSLGPIPKCAESICAS
jgi:hypothetical protein